MSSYLDKTGLEQVWSKATSKFATVTTTDGLKGDIELLTSTKADKSEVQTALENLVGNAPGALNTLNELAAALGDDPNFATTVATEIDKKVNSSEYNDTIGGINASIASITPEKIGALNKEAYLGPVVLEGNPIVYEKGTEGLGIEATSYFELKQAGSGDPYPAGGGKNIINIYSMIPNSSSTLIERTDNTIRVYNTTAGTYNRAYISNMVLKAGVTYTLSAEVTAMPGGYARVGFVNQSTSSIITNGSIVFSKAGKDTITFSVTEDTTVYFAAWSSFSSSIAGDATFKNIQVEISNTATEYTPYENIRPISGYDKLKLNVAGKNLFDFKKPVSYTANVNHEVVGETLRVYTSGEGGTWRGLWYDYFTLKAGTKYTISIDVTEYTSGVMNYGLRRRKNNSFIVSCSATGTGHYTKTYTPSEDVEVYPSLLVTNESVTTGDIVFANAQFEVGSETAYEPYKGKTYTAQIDQTVYGGKINWNTGKLTATHAMYTITGAESKFDWSTNNAGLRRAIFQISEMPAATTDSKSIDYCSHAPYGSTHGTAAAASASGTYIYIMLPTLQGKTKEEAYAWFAAQYAAGTPVQIAYELATPIEIQLTPTQISELSDLNFLYGDGNNIHTIFNTTGGITPVLESISGTLPVEKGGTGATSAAGARSNLGITPANIGALPVAGGTMSGDFFIANNATNTTIRFIPTDIAKEMGSINYNITVNSPNTGFRFVQYSRSSTDYSRTSKYEVYQLPYSSADLTENKWYHILTTKNAVSIAQGGTGASSRSDAWNNIVAEAGIFSGTPVVANASYHGSIWFKATKITSGGENRNATIYAWTGTSDATDLSFTRFSFRQYSANANATTMSSMYDEFYLPKTEQGLGSKGAYDILTTKSAVKINQGGTGATDAATARSNLEITPANIGALSTNGGTLSGNVDVQRTFNEKQHVSRMGVSLATGNAYLAHRTDGVEDNYISLGATETKILVPLSLSSGGTGVNLSSIPNGAVVRNSSDGSGLWYTATKSGAFYATSENANPSFGTLPIAQGGTGATDAATARSNLGITPTNIGAAPKSHASTATTYGVASASNYGHAMASSTTPKANGTAAVGSETAKFARGDHVHPLQTSVTGSSGSCTGNAATATALTTSAGSSSKPVYFSDGKPVAISNIILGSDTDNTYSSFGLKRKSESDSSFARFYAWVAKTGQVAGLEFNHYNASGENDGNTNLYISATAIYPSTNNDKILGASNYKWKTVYATTFDGTATQATSDGDGNTISSTYLKLAGGTMTGDLKIGTTSSTTGYYLRMQRAVGDTYYVSRFYTNGDTGAASIQTMKASTTVNYMYLRENETVFKQPVTLESGGTGATTQVNAWKNIVAAAGTFTGTPVISNAAYYGSIWFKPSKITGDNPRIGCIYAYGSGSSDTNLTHAQFRFRQCSPNTDSTTVSSYYDEFLLPQTSVGKTTSNSYNILTTKSTVTVAQGGTGASSKSGARTNLGITSGTELPSSATAGDIFFLYS